MAGAEGRVVMPSLPRRRLLRAAGALALGAGLLARAQTAPRAIEIVAKKFDFVPGEIRIGLGETVLLKLSAPEVPMGFNLADFQLRADIVPGQETTLQFRPDKAGRFIFFCDVFCGSGHEEMSGMLTVV
jgi:cytochrome c oxidase subunit 2